MVVCVDVAQFRIGSSMHWRIVSKAFMNGLIETRRRCVTEREGFSAAAPYVVTK